MHHSPPGPRFSATLTALVARARYRTAAVLAPLVAVAAFLQRTRVLPVTLAGLVLAALVMATPLPSSLPSFAGDSSTAALTAPTADVLTEDVPTEAAVRELVPATDDEEWTQDGEPAKSSRADRKAKKSAERPSATPTPEETAASADSAPESTETAETSESTEAESSDDESSSDEEAAASSDDAPARRKPASGGGSGGGEGGGLEAQVLSLVNDERAEAGCPALSADSRLAAVARGHSEDMRDRGYFDHDTPEGLSPFDRAEEAGLSNARAENIARGQQSPAAVMDSWMNSSGHRANILDCDLRTLGVGVATGSGGPWWTQLFGV